MCSMWFPLILIASAFYACANVVGSLLVKHYENHPMVLLWTQSIFSICALGVFAMVIDVSTSWAVLFVVTGWLGYMGDYYFYRAAACTDISIVNLAWAILAIFIAIASFIIFGESWTAHQWMGVLFIIGGVVLLSVAHRHLTFWVLFLLTIIALFYTPFYVAQKAAFLSGENITSVLFWMLLGRESLCLFFPLIVPSVRCRIFSLSERVNASYFFLVALIVLLFFSALYVGALAYDAGLASLVAVVSNVQMFMVMFFAWMLWRLIPQYASRELFTRQSVQIKLTSFAIVFVGLALLAVVPS